MTVGTVVVTYNRLDLLRACISSLRSQSFANHKIIVINNGSTDGTTDWLAKQDDLIIINQENSGGAGGFYTGLKYVAENGYEYCWLMDDDVICAPNALEELINATHVINNTEWGFLCSSVKDKEGKPCNVPFIDERHKQGYPSWGRHLAESLVMVRQATFVSVFVPTSIILQYGLPLKNFFIWGDDTEYTIRLSNDLPCYWVGKSIVTHMRVMTQGLDFLHETNPNRIKLYYYLYRNQFYLAKNGYWHKPLPVLRYYVTKLIILCQAIFKLKMKHAKVVAKAIFDGPLFKTQIDYPNNKL